MPRSNYEKPDQIGTISSVTATPVPKYPNWYTLPRPNIRWILADHHVETDIDANGVGRVRIKPGYNANVSDIRYGY